MMGHSHILKNVTIKRKAGSVLKGKRNQLGLCEID